MNTLDKMATGIHRAANKPKSITAEESSPQGTIAVIKDVAKFLYKNEFFR